MNLKKVLIVLIVLLLIGLGLYYFMPQADDVQTNVLGASGEMMEDGVTVLSPDYLDEKSDEFTYYMDGEEGEMVKR